MIDTGPTAMPDTGQRSTDTPTKTSKVSIVLVGYNSQHYLNTCLSALREQSYPDVEIILVDNQSKDDTVAYVQAHFPEVRVVPSPSNLGFSGGNNLGAEHANGGYLAFLNVDTKVEPNWLEPLIRTLETQPNVGLVTAKILLLSEPDIINTCGNDVHFTGYGYLRGWKAHRDTKPTDEEVFSVSGACFVIRKSLFEQLKGFDADFFPAYVEETDLSWRARLAGYSCRFVHESVIYHDYELSFSPLKFYSLERNRYQMLLKNLRWRTLFMLLPAFFLSEMVSWAYALLNGVSHLRAKLRSYWWFVPNWRKLMRKRRMIQQQRQVRDREILLNCVHRLAFGQANEGIAGKIGARVFNPLFYWLMQVYRFTIWW